MAKNYSGSRWWTYLLVGGVCFGLGLGATWLIPQRFGSPLLQPVASSPPPAAVEGVDISEPLVKPKNVILFVGDGMNIATVVASRILAGQQAGESGEENSLSFESFGTVGLAKTYNVNSQVPDSAGTATALMTGEKTDIGVIGVGPGVVRGRCGTVAGNELESWMMTAEGAGARTGLVTTTRITHATPAAAFAITPERGWEADGDIPADCRSYRYGDIAAQLLAFGRYGDGFEVVLGGGSMGFLPDGAGGERLDGRNLLDEWDANGPSWAVMSSWQETLDSDLTSVDHLLGLYAPSHLSYEVDRVANDLDQPSLSDITRLAIGQLASGDSGFALVVEAGRIDHAHHVTNAYRALTETIALSDAVAAALELVDLEETLIVVTADHGHVFTIGGYPERGNDILGFVNDSLDVHGEPYRTLGYANSRLAGYAHDHDENGVIDDDDGIYGEAGRSLFRFSIEQDVKDRGFTQAGLVELSSETHSGEDVPVYSTGPFSDLLEGVMEQSLIGQVLLSVFDLGP